MDITNNSGECFFKNLYTEFRNFRRSHIQFRLIFFSIKFIDSLDTVDVEIRSASSENKYFWYLIACFICVCISIWTWILNSIYITNGSHFIIKYLHEVNQQPLLQRQAQKQTLITFSKLGISLRSASHKHIKLSGISTLSFPFFPPGACVRPACARSLCGQRNVLGGTSHGRPAANLRVLFRATAGKAR